MQLKPDQLQFLAKLSKSPDGARLLELLRDMTADYDKAARTSRGEEVHRALGAAEALDKLFANIVGAAQSLARAETSQRRSIPVARP